MWRYIRAYTRFIFIFVIILIIVCIMLTYNAYLNLYNMHACICMIMVLSNRICRKFIRYFPFYARK